MPVAQLYAELAVAGILDGAYGFDQFLLRTGTGDAANKVCRNQGFLFRSQEQAVSPMVGKVARVLRLIPFVDFAIGGM